MPIAHPSEVSWLYSVETAWDEPPASPKLTPINFLSSDLTHEKEVRRSQRIKANAQWGPSYYTGHRGPGGVAVELARGEYDDFIAGGLRSAPVSIDTTTGADTAFDATAKTITSTATDFAAAGIVAGMMVKFSGSAEAGNNQYFEVASVVTTVITVLDPDNDMVTTSLETITVTGKMWRSGTTDKSFLIENQWTNISQFHYWVGARVNTLEFNVEALEIATMNIGFMAKEMARNATTIGDGSPNTISAAARVASGYQAATMSGFTGWFRKGAATDVNGVRIANLVIDNGITTPPVVEERGPYEIVPHRHSVSGTLTVYYEDETYVDHLLNHDISTWAFKLTDTDGAPIIITLRNVQFDSGFPTIGGAEEDTELALAFTAHEDTYGSTVQIDMP